MHPFKRILDTKIEIREAGAFLTSTDGRTVEEDIRLQGLLKDFSQEPKRLTDSLSFRHVRSGVEDQSAKEVDYHAVLVL